MLSIGGTTWGLENFPGYNIGLCTYGAELSKDFSQAVRDQIERNPDKLETRIRQGSNRIDKFLTETDGGVMAFGVGGAMTGRGFNLFFLDDYIKQLKEALSPVYRQQLWDWFVTTAFTRLEPGATVIIIATRWHGDDLIGRLLKEQPGLWTYIKLPAIAESNDPLGRNVGEALFPERYDLDALLGIKRMLGSFWFSALYQQDPRDDESRMANKEWLQYIHTVPAPNTLDWCRAWDFGGLKKTGDYTCGLKMGANKEKKQAFITDIVRGQWTPDDVDTLFVETARADGPHCLILIAQEPGASGIITTNHFKKLLKQKELYGYTVLGIPELTGKSAKAHGMLAGAERGDLILKYAQWNDCFANEFDGFPNAEYDDQIDCVAIAWNKMIGITKLSATWGRTPAGTGATTTTTAPGDSVNTVRGTRSGNSGVIWGRRGSSGLIVPKKYH
jgi:predicted phage terminase large subunit-like protein